MNLMVLLFYFFYEGKRATHWTPYLRDNLADQQLRGRGNNPHLEAQSF